MSLNLPFHHIGIACYDINATAEFYEGLGYTKSETTYDPIQNVYICFLHKDGEVCIELIAPHDETSPINKNLQKNGVTPYHLCYEAENVEAVIAELKKEKFLQVSRLAPAVAMGNKRVCFLFSKAVGLIELVEMRAT
ncbi:MAG: VOC family protein [Treponema sp.]|nr:VOC family protein [Treponema sp.]